MGIFAGYVASIEDNAWKIAIGSHGEFENWLEKVKERSCFKSEISLVVTGGIVIFSTCSYEFDDARFVLLGIVQEN